MEIVWEQKQILGGNKTCLKYWPLIPGLYVMEIALTYKCNHSFKHCVDQWLHKTNYNVSVEYYKIKTQLNICYGLNSLCSQWVGPIFVLNEGYVPVFQWKVHHNTS